MMWTVFFALTLPASLSNATPNCVLGEQSEIQAAIHAQMQDDAAGLCVSDQDIASLLQVKSEISHGAQRLDELTSRTCDEGCTTAAAIFKYGPQPSAAQQAFISAHDSYWGEAFCSSAQGAANCNSCPQCIQESAITARMKAYLSVEKEKERLAKRAEEERLAKRVEDRLAARALKREQVKEAKKAETLAWHRGDARRARAEERLARAAAREKDMMSLPSDLEADIEAARVAEQADIEAEEERKADEEKIRKRTRKAFYDQAQAAKAMAKGEITEEMEKSRATQQHFIRETMDRMMGARARSAAPPENQ